MPALESRFAQPLSVLGDRCIERIEQAPMPGLRDGPICPELVDFLGQAASTGDQAGNTWPEIPGHVARHLVSGLWLVAGDIDRSHTISQDLRSAEGSFLHGIMHRREGDFGNAKYWFRRVGSHPVIDFLANQVDLRYGDRYAFIDLCEKVPIGDDGAAATACLEIQWLEWQALMAHCVAGLVP